MGPHEGIIYSEIVDYNKFREQVGNEKFFATDGERKNIGDIELG